MEKKRTVELEKKPEELLEQYNKEVSQYFDVDPDPGIKIVIYDSMEELGNTFKEYTDKEPPSYLKGFSPGGDRWREIWLVRAGALDEHGNTLSQAWFNQCIKHEMVHTYQKVFCDKNGLDRKTIPIWFKEGMALCLARQAQIYPQEDVLIKDLQNVDGLDPKKYEYGSRIVPAVLRQYGKEKMLELFSMKDSDEFYAELKRMFDWLK